MTVDDILTTVGNYPREQPLPAPRYEPRDGPRVMLCTPSQARHMSDEGWQLALALRAGGYELFGPGGDVRQLLKCDPSVVFVQDQHEWDDAHIPPGSPPGHLAVPEEKFRNSESLAERQDVFKLTVVKDTHRQYESAKKYSQNIGCHLWVSYYNLRVTMRTLSWIRPQHLIRTWHTIDTFAVPEFSLDRKPCVISGSLGGAYPLRTRIHEAKLPIVEYLKHPGYHNRATNTPGYLRQLNNYKVSIATASKFGYCLRKIIESAACGCRVITDLPIDEIVPDIDENLVRVEPSIDIRELGLLVRKLTDEWNFERQKHFATKAMMRFDYRVEGMRLSEEIETMRRKYR